jgi:hypothetical protein
MNDRETVRPMAGCDMRRRTPQEIAEQLERDATSLTLTGSSFEKDKAFYDTVAANVREAARWLASWEARLAQVTRDLRREQDTGVRAAYADCAGIAANFQGVVTGNVSSERAAAWRGACAAVLEAILAQGSGHPRELETGKDTVGPTRLFGGPIDGRMTPEVLK